MRIPQVTITERGGDFEIIAFNAKGAHQMARASRASVMAAAVLALTYARDGTAKVQFVAPEWVMSDLKKLGWKFSSAGRHSVLEGEPDTHQNCH